MNTLKIVLQIGMASIVTVSATILVAEEDKSVKSQAVTATVEGTLGEGVSIHVKQVPGDFKVPKGSRGRQLRFSYSDPKNDFQRDKLWPKSIYSFTQKRFMTEAASDPEFELPPGDYRLSVGGEAGASGTLSFQMVSSGARAPQGKRYTVTASIKSAVDQGVGIKAVHEPGEFEVPKGQKAVDLTYSYSNPKTGASTDKLSPTSIFSVTRNVYVREAATDLEVELPAGRYRLIVGGDPGATGVLGYTLTSATVTEDDADEKTRTADRVIDVETWVPGREKIKMRAVYYVRGTKVTGEIDQTFDNLYEPNERFTVEPLHSRGTFLGTIANDVISGTWKVEGLPQKWTFTVDGKSYTRVDTYAITIENRAVLLPEGRLTETSRSKGVTEWQYGPEAPGKLSGQHETNKYEATCPDEKNNIPEVKGTWTDRKKSKSAR